MVTIYKFPKLHWMTTICIGPTSRASLVSFSHLSRKKSICRKVMDWLDEHTSHVEPMLATYFHHIPSINPTQRSCNSSINGAKYTHYYKMWVQFTSPHSLQSVNSLKIKWNHLAYRDTFCCSDINVFVFHRLFSYNQ